MKFLRLLPLLIFCLLGLAAAPAQGPDEEIDQLLEHVRQSKATFVRNGKAHDAKQAAEHMQKKRDHFKKKIKTAEDFIRLTATQSLLSGKKYHIIDADGSKQESAVWMTHALHQQRSKQKKQPTTP